MKHIDFPVPLSVGVAWLRLPWPPCSEDEVEHVRRTIEFNLEESKPYIVKGAAPEGTGRSEP
jgi:hypothetical protein